MTEGYISKAVIACYDKSHEWFAAICRQNLPVLDSVQNWWCVFVENVIRAFAQRTTSARRIPYINQRDMI